MAQQPSLRGVAKAFRTSRGVVHAVRELDASIVRGETVALLGPNGAGKSTSLEMLLGLTRPTAATFRCWAGGRARPFEEGLVGAMLQTGALMRDVSPRELVAMVVSLYPHALDVDEALELAGVRDVADRRTQELSGGQAQRVRVAIALARIPKCWCSMSRPWAWTWRPGAASGSRCAPSSARADRHLRDSLPG